MNSSKLFDEKTFYDAFIKDLLNAKQTVVIESAFLTVRRVNYISPTLWRVINNGVNVTINTRLTQPEDYHMHEQSLEAINILQSIGVTVLLTVNHHRKLSIIDQKILWEGSMNILSQSDSCEYMRRIDSYDEVRRTVKFIKLGKWYS